jgi:hypothetical protein
MSHILTFDHRPVDVFVTYDGKRASDISVSRYAVRHLVAQEVSPLIWILLCSLAEHPSVD